MANCSNNVSPQMWADVYQKQSDMLVREEMNGFDTNVQRAELNNANKMMKARFAGAQDKIPAPKARKKMASKPMDSNVLATLIGDKPRLVKERKNGSRFTTSIKIEGANVYDNGAIEYSYKYPKGSKVYKSGSSKVTFETVNDESLVTTTKYSTKYREEADAGEYSTVGKRVDTDLKESLKLLDELIDTDMTEIDSETKSHLVSSLSELVSSSGKYVNNVFVKLREVSSQNSGSVNLNSNSKSADIDISKRMLGTVLGNELSLGEVYVHEMWHAVTHFAFTAASKGGRLRKYTKNLERLREHVMERIDYKFFMPEVSTGDVKAEVQLAKDMFDHINTDIEEFVAYAKANKKFRDKLKSMKVPPKFAELEGEGFVAMISNMFIDLLNYVFDSVDPIKGTTVDAAVGELVIELMNANKKAQDLAKEGFIEKHLEGVTDLLQVGSDKWTTFIDKITGILPKDDDQVQKVLKEQPKATDSTWKKRFWSMRLIASMFRHPELRGLLSSAMDAIWPWGMGYGSTVQMLMKSMQNKDEMQYKVSEIGLIRENIDRIRHSISTSVSRTLREGFGRKLNKKEQKSITEGILYTDLGSLLEVFTNGEIGKLLLDPKHLDKLIAQVKDRIITDPTVKSTKNADLFIDLQIEGMVKWLNTGVMNVTQLPNAEMIARFVDTEYEMEASKGELATHIDTISTLMAIKGLDDSVKEQLGLMAKENLDGLLNYALISKNFANDSKKLSGTSVKGYVKNISKKNANVVVRKIADGEELEKQGYVLMDSIDDPTSTSKASNGKLGVYVDATGYAQGFNLGAMSIADIRKHVGTAVFNENTYKEKQTKLEIQAAKIALKKTIAAGHKKVFNGNRDGYKGSVNVATLRDSHGKPSGFSFLMNRKEKEKYMGIETNPNAILGGMQAMLAASEESQRVNAMLMEELFDDMNANVDFDDNGEPMYDLGENNQSYIKIQEFSDNDKVKDIFNIMPQDMKQAIKNSENGLWVRENDLYEVFGFRDASIINSKAANWVPGLVKRMVKIATQIWKTLVKLYKIDILLRTPEVVIGNVVSNAFYLVQSGGNPATVVRMHKEAWSELDAYVRMKHEVDTLKAKKGIRKLTDSEVAKMERMQSLLDTNPVSKLVDYGMYQAIVEDLGLEESSISNPVEQWIDEKLDDLGAPEVVKTGVSWVYVSEKTMVYKYMHKALQYGDFMARYTQYNMGVKRATKKFAKDNNGKKPNDAQAAKISTEILREANEAYINYNEPEGAFFKWMNDMGILMFTKYAIRIQKVISNGVVKHPVQFLLAAIGQEAFGVDIDDVADRSLFARGPFSLLFMPSNDDVVYRSLVPFMVRAVY